MFVIS